MKKNIVTLGLTLSVACLLNGCFTEDPNASNENRGRLIGGLAGIIVADKVSNDDKAPAVGAVVGSYVGGEMGRQQDQKNRDKAAQLLNSTLAKASSTWTDDDNTEYTFTASQPYQNNGNTCRPYTLKRQLNGAASTKNGIACLSADKKVWQLT